jgi:NAD(P)-dependent dehydrogenase (short-subunit alcohol dehydrogenase family)
MFARISQQYQNKTAVVIGAGGIGGAIAELLAPCAAKLVVADHDAAALKNLPTPLGGAQLLTRTLDVHDAKAVAELFESLKTTLGVPDYLFYTAGILNIESLAETTSEIWDRAVATNLSGAFYCAQAAAEQMRAARRGSILILGSIAGTKARSGSRVNPVYNATKAGLAAFVNAAAMQLRNCGVRINCISPGPTATRMMDVQPARVHAAVNELTLEGRMNSATEVAELALFVAAHGRFTGEDVCMGGGAGLGG